MKHARPLLVGFALGVAAVVPLFVVLRVRMARVVNPGLDNKYGNVGKLPIVVVPYVDGVAQLVSQ